MKKILGVVLALTIAFAMTACGAQEDGVHAVTFKVRIIYIFYCCVTTLNTMLADRNDS